MGFLFSIIAFAAIYTIVCIIKKTTCGLFVLAISGIVVILVINFKANANRHIHIPEYVPISWILHPAPALIANAAADSAGFYLRGDAAGSRPHDDFNGHACAGIVGGETPIKETWTILKIPCDPC